MGEMAPYLLFGFLMAGVLHVLLRPNVIKNLLGKQGVSSNLKSTVLGIPLPICSCGVLPLAASLKREGASSGSTVSFLTATPQTGVDSILATHALMGPVFAGFRVVVAFISGLLTGSVVDLVEKRGTRSLKPGPLEASPEEDPCGCGHQEVAGTEPDSNCHTCGGNHEEGASVWDKTRSAMRYGFIVLPGELTRAMIIGLILAAAITVWMPTAWIEPLLGYPLLLYVGITLISIPLYVCSTGSIPLAYSLLGLGLSPGAALVFLITGPATNAATLSVIQKQMGWRILMAFLVSLLGCAWLAGWGMDQLALRFPQLSHSHHEMTSLNWFQHLSALGLFVILAIPLMKSMLAPKSDPSAAACSPCCQAETLSNKTESKTLLPRE